MADNAIHFGDRVILHVAVKSAIGIACTPSLNCRGGIYRRSPSQFLTRRQARTAFGSRTAMERVRPRPLPNQILNGSSLDAHGS